MTNPLKRLAPRIAKTVRIGGASGFWGDSMVAAPQLVASGEIDYLVFDYLAETTMAIMAATRAKKPELGYATDFVDSAMKAVLPQALERGIKVIANAGGINPEGCANALKALAQSTNLARQPRIAVVTGDDVLMQMTSDGSLSSALPAGGRPLSANAYLGAAPVAQALAMGADVVITGRAVDSAVTLGALIYEFSWSMNDFDRLAGASLAGHIIECGCQATGGLFTDWQDVPDWATMGYPIATCFEDGSFEITKPKQTGGLISHAAIAEQLLYEIGDPGDYELPDVCCDFRHVKIEQVSQERVRVSGARGLAPSNQYKVSATAMNGYRCSGALVIIGRDAAAKAQRTGEAIIERCRGIFKQLGMPDFTATAISLLGAESLYGASARTTKTREAWLRITVNHALKPALEIFAKEIAPAGTSWSPGTTGPGLARPAAAPLIQSFSSFIPKNQVPVAVVIDGQIYPSTIEQFSSEPIPNGSACDTQPAVWVETDEPQIELSLVDLAWARSGDKGDISNIGVIARRPEWLPLLWNRLSTIAVKQYLAHLVKGEVKRFYLPGIHAMNFMLFEALDGGGTVSTRMDPLGKGIGQILLDMPILVPASIAKALGQKT